MLKKDQAALVVIDVQGKLATLMHDKENFYANVVRIINGAKVLEMPIVWNEQLPDKLGPTLDQIKEALEGYTPMIKAHFSCCGNEEFNKALAATGRKQVLLCGMESHVCVYQTAQDLIADGYEVYVVADAVASRNPENRRIGLEAMRDLGARIGCVEMYLFEMLHKAEGDQFRQCVKIVK